MTEQLKPCPHLEPCPYCGEPLTTVWRKINPRASCKTEGCFGRKMAVVNIDDAEDIEAWNRRAQPAPITSESGKAPAQGASAITSGSVPVLTYEEIAAEIRERGSMVNGVKGDGFIQGARWAERAVRSKMGVPQWLPIETAPKDCGFLGYQPLTDDMWISAPMYWAGSEFLLLQFHHGDTEHSMTPTHWMPLPPPPGIVGKDGGNV